MARTPRSVTFVSESSIDRLRPPPSTWYRCTLPARGLRQHGLNCYVVPQLTVDKGGRIRGVLAEACQYLGNRPVGIKDRRGILPPTDVVVLRLHQQAHDSAEIIERARSNGQRVFIDFDDNIWQLPDDNPAAEKWDEAQWQFQSWNMNAADGVLVSTWTLAEIVAAETTAPIFVCPNGVDVTDFARRDFEHRPLRVGWFGFVNWRALDLATVADQVGPALNRRGLELWHLGDDPRNRKLRDVLELPVPIREVASVAIPDLGKLLGRVDLVLLPMRDIPLSQSRSATAALACCAAGVPFVASESRSYHEAMGRYPTFAELDVMLDDRQVREAWSHHGHDIAVAHAPKRITKFWLEAFRTASRQSV